MAAAVGLTRAGWQPDVCERAAAFSEVGAGVQLGPNVTRILQAWGCDQALRPVVFQPERLVARSLDSGVQLAALSLQDMAQRYGAPYLTIHRADLHDVLLRSAQAHGVALQTDTQVCQIENVAQGVVVGYNASRQATRHDGAVVADGVWSQLRQQLLNDGSAQFTGHVAYRALVSQASLPASLRTQNVTVWMGAHAHVVHYPVRGGEWLNVVCLIEDAHPFGKGNANEPQTWQRLQTWNTQNTFEQTQQSLMHALRGAHTSLKNLIEHCQDWRLWPLCGRTPMQGAYQMAQGRVALMGDAAHPMLPYLAQGAGMAIEDAQELGLQMRQVTGEDVPRCLQKFAQARWQRNALVQNRALRNGDIFHATGPMRMARNAGLRVLGSQLMDVPWLYGYNAARL